MRVFILLAAFLFSFTISKAQLVSGNVKDAEGKPMAGSTIKLLKDSLLVKLAVSNDKGAFSFSNVSSGNYMVNISHVGYPATNSASFIVNGTDISIPEIVITKSAVDLKAVQVVAQKPIVEVKADKT
ncbi:MAG TPA: carboxypeptidase-like regulatory domain-containing protein, partial [Ferruginibacter sp.]|nr:carboxypeptidase-like regulatory domain-containing protein [Ferruginibacter sp.]